MQLDTRKVLGLCQALSPLQRNYVLRHRVDVTKPYPLYAGMALLLWAANHFYAEHDVDADQLRILVDHFGDNVVTFGNMVGEEYYRDQTQEGFRKLSEMRIAFLDRHFVVADSVPSFLDLTTGETIEAVSYLRPLRKVEYSLTSLFVRYYNQYRRPQ